MTSIPNDPNALYDKPHSVDLAQVMMVFQYFMLVSVSVGVGPRLFNWVKGETEDVPLLADVEAAIDIGSSYPIAVVLPVLLVLRMARGAHPQPLRWGRVVPAYAIGSLAFFWMLERAAILFG